MLILHYYVDIDILLIKCNNIDSFYSPNFDMIYSGGNNEGVNENVQGLV